MKHARVLLPALAIACSAKSLTGADVCDLIRLEVEARVVTCTGDKDRAAAAVKSLDAYTCLLPEEDTAIGVHGPSLSDCLAAITAADCDEVDVHADRAEYWLGLDFHCPQYIGTPSDTGAAR